MKSFKSKLAIVIITILLITMILPFKSVLATNEGIQLIETTDGNIVIYVDGLEETSFDYALSSTDSATEMDLNYINSVQDEEGNQVALIATEDLAENNYLYIRKEDNTVTTVKLDTSNIFTLEEMRLVESITNRISTEAVENLSSRQEVIEDVTYTYTVGGLKITDDQNASYYYVIVELPDNNGYSELKSLADELNSNYESKTMYSKIEFANIFYNQYISLIENAENENSWQLVENMQILQPEDYEQDDEYVVMLKKVSEDGTITYDTKFMTTYVEVAEEIIPATTTQVETQETSKLPITGDSILLFVLLAALVIIAIVVFVRMKKLDKKADK